MNSVLVRRRVQSPDVYIKPLAPPKLLDSARARRRRGEQQAQRGEQQAQRGGRQAQRGVAAQGGGNGRARAHPVAAAQPRQQPLGVRAVAAEAATAAAVACAAAAAVRERVVAQARFPGAAAPPHRSPSLLSTPRTPPTPALVLSRTPPVSIAPSSPPSDARAAAPAAAPARPVFEPFAALRPIAGAHIHDDQNDDRGDFALSAVHFMPPLLAASLATTPGESESGVLKLPPVEGSAGKDNGASRRTTMAVIKCAAPMAPRAKFFAVARGGWDDRREDDAAACYIRHAAKAGLAMLPALLSLPRDDVHSSAERDAHGLNINANAVSDAQCFALSSAVGADPLRVRSICITQDGGFCQAGVIAILQRLFAAAGNDAMVPAELGLTKLDLHCKLDRRAAEQAIIPLLSGRPYDGSPLLPKRAQRRKRAPTDGSPADGSPADGSPADGSPLLPKRAQRRKRAPAPPPPALAPLKLRELSVAGTKLREPTLAAHFALGLRRSGQSLVHLDCSGCALGASAAALGSAFTERIAGILEPSALARSLRVLNIAQNELHGEATTNLLRLLRRFASALRFLDLQKNSLGLDICNVSGPSPSSAAACPPCVVDLSKWLGGEEGCLLAHLDLRFNSLAAPAVRQLANSLRSNRVTHIHCGAGNPGASCPIAVDTQGFVVTDNNNEHGALRTLSLGLAHIEGVHGTSSATASDNCWICGGWMPRLFTWRRSLESDEEVGMGVPARVCVRFGFEGWRRVDLVRRSDAAFEVERVVPPGVVSFVFEGQFEADGEVGTTASLWRPLGCCTPGDSRSVPHCRADFPQSIVPLQQAGCPELEVLLEAGGPGASACGRPDPISGVYMHTVRFPPREGWLGRSPARGVSGGGSTGEEELRGRLRPPPPQPLPPPKKVVQKKAWRFPDSIFAPYRGDHVFGGGERTKLLDSAFESDWNFSSAARIILKAAGLHKPAPDDINTVPAVVEAKELCRETYPVVSKCFRHYSSTSSEVHTMGWNAFTDFVNAARITEGAGGARGHECTRAAVDMAFMSCCTGGPAGPSNPKRSLVRWQFLESVVRMGMAKYAAVVESSSSSDDEDEDDAQQPERVQSNTVLALQRIAADIQPCERDNDVLWYKRFWVEECDDLLRASEAALHAVYKKYTDMDRHEVQGAPGMQLQTWRKLLSHVGALDKSFNERELRLCFVYAASTRRDEFTKTAHIQRDFQEFLDAVGRFADTKDMRPLDAAVRHGPGAGPMHEKLVPALKMITAPLSKGFTPAQKGEQKTRPNTPDK